MQSPKHIAIYPRRCSQKVFETGQPCNATLTKSGSSNGKSIRVPIKPYVVQTLNGDLSRLLSRPGIASALRMGSHIDSSLSNIESSDIWHGSVLRGFLKGPDGRPFIADNGSDELRLVFSMAVDWFNPGQVKAAGKQVSLGFVIFACLNLPPELRNKRENLFLAAILPGPKETSLDGINKYMHPIVNMLLQSWNEGGSFYSRDDGGAITVRAMVACLVADLIAAHKVSGVSHHSATKFCGLCEQRRGDLNNIDVGSWKARALTSVVEAALKWRDAPTRSERKRLFKQTGVRWS